MNQRKQKPNKKVVTPLIEAETPSEQLKVNRPVQKRKAVDNYREQNQVISQDSRIRRTAGTGTLGQW